MTDEHEPNPIEIAAHLVSHTAPVQYHGKLHHISVRLQAPNFLAVQAMAETSGLTRSDMVNRVLEAGIYAIRGELTEEALEILDFHMRRASGEFLEDVEREAKQ